MLEILNISRECAVIVGAKLYARDVDMVIKECGHDLNHMLLDWISFESGCSNDRLNNDARSIVMVVTNSIHCEHHGWETKG